MSKFELILALDTIVQFLHESDLKCTHLNDVDDFKLALKNSDTFWENTPLREEGLALVKSTTSDAKKCNFFSQNKIKCLECSETKDKDIL